jgi:hypothetical protein
VLDEDDLGRVPLHDVTLSPGEVEEQVGVA